MIKANNYPLAWVDSQLLLIHLYFLDVCELLKVPMQIHLKKSVGTSPAESTRLQMSTKLLPYGMYWIRDIKTGPYLGHSVSLNEFKYFLS